MRAVAGRDPAEALDVIRHRAGARRTALPKGSRCSRGRSAGGGLDDAEAAVDGVLEAHEATAELLGRHPADDLLGQPELLLHLPADVGADLGHRRLGGVGAVGGLDGRELDDEGQEEGLLAERSSGLHLVQARQDVRAQPRGVQARRAPRATGNVTETTIPALARTAALTSGASAWMMSSPLPVGEERSVVEVATASPPSARSDTPAGGRSSASKPGPMSYTRSTGSSVDHQ